MIDNFALLRRLAYGLQFLKWKLLGLNAQWYDFGTIRISSTVRILNPKNVSLARGVTLFPYCYLKSTNGKIFIGADSSIGEYSYINSVEAVNIGSNVLIAPSCHITDANHGIAANELIRKQLRDVSPVGIGNGAWLGAGCKVLKGVQIAAGAVIGAGAVVSKNIGELEIAVGVPAKVVGSRLNISEKKNA